MIGLNDKEIAQAVDKVYPGRANTYQVNAADRAIRDEQLKKFVEWVNNRPHVRDTIKSYCELSWQSLLSEVKNV